MAQNVTIAGRQYSAVPAIDIPKTGGGTATFTDVTDTTAIASDVASGKYFFTASGVLTLGTATGGGGTGGVTQDQDGYLVLDDQAPPPTPSGGLEYEEGIFEPETDIAHPTIAFTNTHTTRPYSAVVLDVTGTASANYSALFWALICWYDVFGETPAVTSGVVYGGLRWGYSSSNGYAANGANINVLTGGGTNSSLDFSVSNTAITPYLGSNSFLFRAGRKYKWIAVWRPTP